MNYLIIVIKENIYMFICIYDNAKVNTEER